MPKISRQDYLLETQSHANFPQISPRFQKALNLLRIFQKEEGLFPLSRQKFLLQQKCILFLCLEGFGIGKWDKKNKLIVPNDIKLVCKEWKNTAMKIYHALNLPSLEMDNPSTGMTKKDWVNTSRSVEALLTDARKTSFFFLQLCKKITDDHIDECFLSFGTDNLHMIKNESSLRKKIEKYKKLFKANEEESIAKIGDILRSTIITKGLKPIPSIIKTVIKEVRKHGGQLYIKNFWKANAFTEEEMLLLGTGYSGVHLIIRMPLHAIEANHVPTQENQTAMPQQEKYLQMEIQIHPKEFIDVMKVTHPIYKKQRAYSELNFATKLLNLMAMKNMLEEFHKGFSRQKIFSDEILNSIINKNLTSYTMKIKDPSHPSFTPLKRRKTYRDIAKDT